MEGVAHEIAIAGRLNDVPLRSSSSQECGLDSVEHRRAPRTEVVELPLDAGEGLAIP